MAYLDLINIAKAFRQFIEQEIKEQMARIPKGRFDISRLSTFAADGSVKRWRKPTAADTGKLVRVSQEPVSDPIVLQLGRLEWAGDGTFDHPFSVTLNNESYVKAYRYAWIEIETKPAENPAPASGDTIEAHGWLWRKATEGDVGKEAYFCFFRDVNEPGAPPGEFKLKIAGYSEGFFISSAENEWKARLAWIPVKQLESTPEATSIIPEPEHPEPVEIIKAPASDPNLTIYIHQRKIYRLANSSDIGKQVFMSDGAFIDAITQGTEMLLEILDDVPHPYETTSGHWKLAFVEDSSLILDEPAEVDEIKTDEQLRKSLAEIPPASEPESLSQHIENELGLQPGSVDIMHVNYSKPDAEKWLHDGKRYRRATAADVGKECWVSDVSFERAMTSCAAKLEEYADGDEYPFRRSCEWRFCWVLDEDQEIEASEIVCEAVPAPDGSTTDQELPPKKYRMLGPDEPVQEGDWMNAKENESQSLCPLAHGFIKIKHDYYKGKTPSMEPLFNFAREIEPEARNEPEWITPGPEHVGQMVEVRQFQGGEPWKERQLLAILPETQDSRYICRSSAISSHQNGWVYARVRKAQQ